MGSGCFSLKGYMLLIGCLVVLIILLLFNIWVFVLKVVLSFLLFRWVLFFVIIRIMVFFILSESVLVICSGFMLCVLVVSLIVVVFWFNLIILILGVCLVRNCCIDCRFIFFFWDFINSYGRFKNGKM